MVEGMNLAKTQALSLFTKAITTGLGVVQALLVVTFLSKGEYGLVGLVMSIGSVVGVTQHLGVVDGAIREIAVLKEKQQIGKVFWVSHLVRQAVTLPLSLGLVALAGVIAARIYGRPEIVLYIQIFAGSLILQGLQDVLGATLTGMKKFVELYVVQIVTALVNIFAFGYFTWRFGIDGFFWAVILTTSLMVVIYACLIRRELGAALKLPTWAEARFYLRRVMRVAVYMYLARIFFVVWQRLPLLLLGVVLANDALGEINLSLQFGARLTILAMALSEVNLSWMSSLFATKPEEFRRVVTRNMQRVLLLLVTLTLVVVFFAPEILLLPPLVEYASAGRLIMVMMLAFFLYSLVDIGTSSVFVPADRPRLRTIIYGLMTGVTAAALIPVAWWQPSALIAGLTVLVGAVLAYGLTVWLAWSKLKVKLLTKPLALSLLLLAASVGWLWWEPVLLARGLVFVIIVLVLGMVAKKSKLLPRFARSGKAVGRRVICFSGAAYDAVAWTNRQQMMSRVAKQYPVLYVEPRIWLLRFMVRHWRSPKRIWRFLRRLVWHEQCGDRLFIKAQANLIPGSREIKIIARLNYWLNRWNVLLTARWLGFERGSDTVLWIYDTEAAEYLLTFAEATVLYDCVDDHAAQAGVDRNPARVQEEEDQILRRANLVTVTSKRLLELKKDKNSEVHLVLNAGNVELFAQPQRPQKLKWRRPILGTVGSLDAYKLDVELLVEAAQKRPEWSFVLVGEPALQAAAPEIKKLSVLNNVYLVGAIAREQVPAYVQAFDVCLIPYRSSAYNAASFPLKFWEFMVTGKPLVVSGLPELYEYRELIGYAKGVEDFIAKCKQALVDNKEEARRRRELALGHSWEGRVKQVLGLLDKAQRI